VRPDSVIAVNASATRTSWAAAMVRNSSTNAAQRGLSPGKSTTVVLCGSSSRMSAVGAAARRLPRITVKFSRIVRKTPECTTHAGAALQSSIADCMSAAPMEIVIGLT
jgi:hypothetical protein